MKIKHLNDLIIIYLYKYQFDINNKNDLYQEIKNLFVNLIKNYKLNLFGYYKVDIYENKKYGYILEINKIYGNDNDFIDLKLILHHNTKFYLMIDDFFFLDLCDVIKYQNCIDIEKIDNLDKIIEFGEIRYDK